MQEKASVGEVGKSLEGVGSPGVSSHGSSAIKNSSGGKVSASQIDLFPSL